MFPPRQNTRYDSGWRESRHPKPRKRIETVFSQLVEAQIRSVQTKTLASLRLRPVVAVLATTSPGPERRKDMPISTGRRIGSAGPKLLADGVHRRPCDNTRLVEVWRKSRKCRRARSEGARVRGVERGYLPGCGPERERRWKRGWWAGRGFVSWNAKFEPDRASLASRPPWNVGAPSCPLRPGFWPLDARQPNCARQERQYVKKLC